jgi:hypothetical protein
MITAFFTPYYKFLQKDSYLKFFNEVESLNDLIAKIKVRDKIKIYAHSKDIIKFQFGNTNSNIEYEFLEDSEIFDDFINKGDKVKGKVKEKWNWFFGEYLYLVQDREEQIRVVKDLDVCAIQATDINQLRDNLVNRNEIGDSLVNKMFCTDEEIEQLATQEGR